MSKESKQQKSENSAENAVNLILNTIKVKSLAVIHDVAGGEIYGATDDTDHEMELASGVTYLVIGLGKVDTDYEQGITFLDT